VQLKLIRYIQFQKGSKNMVYKVFSLKDILYFLDNNDYKVSKGFSKIRNVQVVEIGEKI